MNASFEDRLSQCLEGTISEEDYAIFRKAAQSGDYDAEIGDAFYAMLESLTPDCVTLSEHEQERIFQQIIARKPSAVSRLLRSLAKATGAVATRTVVAPAVCLLPRVIRIFNDKLGRQEVIINVLIL